MSERVYNVLFLCTANSARSIMAEACLRSAGREHLGAYSAGSHPAGRVNPFALELLEKKGISTRGLRSKSWDEFASPDAPKMDVVITVCDGAAGEACPVWPGQPIRAHWGIPDPAAVAGGEESKRVAFRKAFATLEKRINLLATLRLDELDRATAEQHIRLVGETQ